METKATTTTTPNNTTHTNAKATEAVVVLEDHGGPRRRTGGHKRKSNTLSSSSSSSKRVARHKTLTSTPFPHHLHNGPITRARQSPNKVAIAGSFGSSIAAPGALGGAHGQLLVQNVSDVDAAKLGVQGLSEDSKPPLEKAIDAEFEAIRSRDPNAHVVPTPAAWFSWTKIHPLEERALASFFDGKSEKKTPDKYMEIRNSVMKKYHTDPNTQIESKDLLELGIGELDARQEIMEFLDHWGLINFHPFPVSNSDKADVNADVPAKVASLVEKLYRFEAVQPCPRVGPRADMSTPAIPPWSIPESSIADEVRAEGPSVEYHCNSCSADCSRKRFHCQKQADFDLCSECFSNGKFDSGMSPADFILMESAEVPGVSGGSWTDQETLLLLEALELFGENWNEIAEHVATKSKAQCILHFLQMPIEDTFSEGGDDFESGTQGKSDPILSDNHASPAKDSHETLADKCATSNGASALKESIEAKMSNDGSSTLNESAETKMSKDGSSTPKESLETTMTKDAAKNDSATTNNAPETMETKNATNVEPPLSPKVDISEPKDASELNVSPETSIGTNFAINVLKEAFQAIGFIPGPGESLSFAEAGNPVMALAIYLTGLVDADVATASARSSLKALSEDAPGIQLAARHCFLLEDPPDTLKKAPPSESANVEMVDQETKKNEGKKEENNQMENQMLVSDGSDVSKDCTDQKTGTVSKEKQITSSNEGEAKLHAAKEVDDIAGEKDVTPSDVEESSNSALSLGAVTEPGDRTMPMDVTPSTVTKSDEATCSTVKKSDEVIPTTVEKPDEVTPSTFEKPDEVTPSTVEKPDEVTPSPVEKSDEVTPSTVKKSDEVASPSTLKNSPSSVKESADAATVTETSQCMEVPKAADRVFDSVPSEDKDPQRTVASNSNIEAGTKTGENDGSKMVDCNMLDTRDEQIADKLKRAAVTTLSAAAVKAKLFANEEEYQIRKLATFLIDKQLQKLEAKMAFFSEMESMIARVREHMERSRQRLYHERAQIIAARLGLPASSSRVMPPSLPTGRLAMNYTNSVPKPMPRGPIHPSR